MSRNWSSNVARRQWNKITQRLARAKALPRVSAAESLRVDGELVARRSLVDDDLQLGLGSSPSGIEIFRALEGYISGRKTQILTYTYIGPLLYNTTGRRDQSATAV